eukprot:Platyproteum_vivax@DN11332_c0_g1_i1.p1
MAEVESEEDKDMRDKKWDEKKWDEKNIQERELDISSFYSGLALVVASCLMFVVGLYTIVFSKLLPDTGNAILDAIKSDCYYCCLIPLMIPTCIGFIYWNWVSMKFFRHS